MSSKVNEPAFVLLQTFSWAAHGFADDYIRVSTPMLNQKLCQLTGRRVVPGQGEDAGARLQERDDPFQRSAVQRDQRTVLYRPAETARCQTEAGGTRQTDHLLRRNLLSQQGANSVEEGITGRHHAYRSASARENVWERGLWRRGPCQGFASYDAGDERKMPPATHHKRRLPDQRPCGRRQTFQTILADPDDRQPAFGGAQRVNLRRAERCGF